MALVESQSTLPSRRGCHRATQHARGRCAGTQSMATISERMDLVESQSTLPSRRGCHPTLATPQPSMVPEFPWVHAQMEHPHPHPQMLAESQPMPPQHTRNKGTLLQTSHQQMPPPPLQDIPVAGHLSPTSFFSMEVGFGCERVTFAMSAMPSILSNARVHSLWRLAFVVRGAPRWSRATPWSSVKPLTYPAPQNCLNTTPHCPLPTKIFP